ncbi:MAG: hypothetical protein WAT12_07320 [Candidatus Nitrotoga sp.]
MAHPVAEDNSLQARMAGFSLVKPDLRFKPSRLHITITLMLPIKQTLFSLDLMDRSINWEIQG